jgi:uncharacterized membrane protein SpoIIM required for sporulation
MDLNTFISDKQPEWGQLERLLGQVDSSGLKGLDLEDSRRLATLYRSVSSDLVRARSLTANPELLGYLNGLVGRSYAHIYATRRFGIGRLWRFFAVAYPRLVRREFGVIAFATAVFMAGTVFGAGAMLLDRDAGAYLLIDYHRDVDPSDRVAAEAESGGTSAGRQAEFSTFLFTHNIQVTFLVFVLGLTFGVGTFIVLFVNGLYLGSLAVNYHFDGVGTFFYAWILPHGVPELTAIFIAGGAGFIIGRVLWNPGRRTRSAALKLHAGRAVKLILGTAPILVVAGLIEGTISQMHPPAMPYWIKLGVAGTMAVLLVCYLAFSGRRSDTGAA